MSVHYRNDSAFSHKDAVDSDVSLQQQLERRRSSCTHTGPPNTGNAAISSTTGSSEQIALDAAPAVSTASTSSAPSTSAPRKSRVTLACKRCKHRKQRCDGAHPCCRSCDRVGVACAYERPVRPQYPGGKALYISALEERIAFLEARMPDHAEDHFVTDLNEHLEIMTDNDNISPMEHPIERSSSHNRSTRNSISDSVDDRTSLVDGVAYLSLCASGTTDATSEPYYVGSSSGATIARVIQSSIFRGTASRVTEEASAAPKQHASNALVTLPPTPSLSAASDTNSLEFPELEQARMLFDAFFERIHTRWPLLDRVVYEDLFMKQYSPGALTVVERSIFHLIYAITARFMSLTRKLHSVDSERHLLAATEPMDSILEQHSLATLQFLVLLGVHGQRSSYGAGAWTQIRYATSVCIEMGLHRKQTRIFSVAQARDVEIRRRIFWSCYCLDRATSIVLGRAFAIADRDINVELPSAGGQFWSLTHREARDPSQGHWSNVEPFIHIIKLDQINSRIHRTVFRVDKDVFNSKTEERAKLDQKVSTIRADLDDWMRNCPQTPKESNKVTWMYDPESAYLDARDFYGVQYHKAILSLFTIFLPTLETSDPRFVTCARSAASVCTAYKRLNQNRTLTYTMISLHSCFVAGLTLVYCIWRDRNIFSYDTLEATRDCSQSLTIFGEKWPGAVKYRDIFDALSGNLLKTVVNPASSTLAQDSPARNTGHTNAARSSRAQQTQQAKHGRAPAPASSATDSTMGHMVSDAMKEAFMEVDDEAPGGWQGWRMWNEMVHDEATAVPDPASRAQGAGYSNMAMGWNGYEGLNTYGVDPVQNSAMQMGSFADMDESQWELDGFR